MSITTNISFYYLNDFYWGRTFCSTIRRYVFSTQFTPYNAYTSSFPPSQLYTLITASRFIYINNASTIEVLLQFSDCGVQEREEKKGWNENHAEKFIQITQFTLTIECQCDTVMLPAVLSIFASVIRVRLGRKNSRIVFISKNLPAK